jgi:hypothetical protein
MRRMEFALYFANAPAPKAVTREQLERLIPVQYPWLIEGPGVRLDARAIGKRCEPILGLFKGSQ